MRAVGLTRHLPIEDAHALMDLELEKPEPAGRDLLVAVKAIAVNPVDDKVRQPNNTDKDAVAPSPKFSAGTRPASSKPSARM